MIMLLNYSQGTVMGFRELLLFIIMLISISYVFDNLFKV